MRNHPLLFKLVWALRRIAGITPEKLNFQFHLRNQKKLFEDYFRKNTLYKLQIGAQSNSISDWLNVDIAPKSREVAYMDATQTFPFEENTFDFIFSEHMIEHIGFEAGAFMLKECYRTLKRVVKLE
ncbi:MAG: methyltransferase domain-containing protein [Microscillaceae bacterium]|nr:methyltransferase domain-containing protein [Microscillaceae bacterium]